MHMTKVGAAVAALGLIALAGCTVPAVPEGYKGPTAYVSDTFAWDDSTSADFFYLDEIDGRAIENSLGRTRQANYGQGFNMRPQVIGRTIPAQPCKVRLTGRTNHAAPILGFLNREYSISGTIAFTPESGHAYTVHGEMNEQHSIIWLADDATNAVIDHKIEVQGVSSLEFWQK